MVIIWFRSDNLCVNSICMYIFLMVLMGITVWNCDIFFSLLLSIQGFCFPSPTKVHTAHLWYIMGNISKNSTLWLQIIYILLSLIINIFISFLLLASPFSSLPGRDNLMVPSYRNILCIFQSIAIVSLTFFCYGNYMTCFWPSGLIFFFVCF